jgi:nucleotide-binding universal stress UspA family protein
MTDWAASFRPDGVVVGDDGSDNAAAAVRFAAEEAARRGARLHVVAAYSVLSAPRPADLPFGYVATQAEMAEAVLAELRARWDGLGEHVQMHALHAPAAEVLIAAGLSADVVVVGARGVGGFDALLLGSVADQVVHHAHAPVIVVKG